MDSVKDPHNEAKSYSKWVIQNILSINRSLGESFEGFEAQSISISSELEKRMEGEKPGDESSKRVKKNSR